MIVCFDLETTGLDKYNDKIIEIAMIKFDEKTFEVIDTFNSLVNPGIHIPDLISNITNIKDDDVKCAPSFDDLKKEIIEFIGDAPLLGHNVYFDIDFFVNNGIDVNNNIAIDTFFLANFLLFKESSLNLEMLCNSYGIGFRGAHRAMNDVKATIELFQKLLGSFNKLKKEQKHLLYYLFNKSEDKNVSFLRDFLFYNIDSNLDFEGFERKILKIVGKIDKKEGLIIDRDIDNNMSIRFESLDKVEKRDNQLKMTNMVMDYLSSSKKIVIEAPTGLGKSFAYLIPSITHSLKTGEKVFVSTKTKTLQDQLYFRDLAYLKENFGSNFNYTKLKGKKNYLSIKQFFDEIWLEDITYTKIGFLSKIVLWLYESEYGELDELNYFGQEFSFLRGINADNFSVLSDKNIYKEYEFLYKARVKLESSNIVVINHSLLFSDLSTETGVLGKIRNLVIDEGHNIEDSVTESLKQRYNLNVLNELFDSIEKIFIKLNLKKINFLKYKENLILKLELLDDYSYSYLDSKISSNNVYKLTLLKQDFFDNEDYTELIKKIELDFIDIIDSLSIMEEYDFSKEVGYLQESLDIIKIFVNKEAYNKYIRILNYNDNSGLSFEYTLLNPGIYLKENLWNSLDFCLLTSATLEIGGKFDYFKKLLLLDNFDFYTFESDFDYKKQATLFIPTDIGNIKNNNDKVIDLLYNFYSVVRGKVLTLLTSFSVIKKIYTALNNELKKQNINLYAQGVGGSKIKLLSFYMSNTENSIILGTDSFWEGVDIPGDDLKYLVIHKFPFFVPTDPVFQARSIFFKDPFTEYSIPRAIIKLKQGFGRLIRTKKDTGIVLLLDDRIYSTPWGKEFYNAFPNNINIKKGSSEQFLNILRMKL